MQTAVHFAEGFEEIEALAVVDILRRASIPTIMVSVTGQLAVTGSHQIRVYCDKLFEEVDYESIDMLILPGGMPGASHLQQHEGLNKQILRFNAEKKKLAAICAAPMVLGKLGVLDGKKAICFPGFEQHLQGVQLQSQEVVVDRHIVTAKGAGVAIDFAFELVEALKGKEFADDLAAKMIHQRRPADL